MSQVNNPNNNEYPHWGLNSNLDVVYEYGSLNSGDTAWMLTSTALVLLMTMPGLAIYYSGMVRDKNVLACRFTNSPVTTDHPNFALRDVIS